MVVRFLLALAVLVAIPTRSHADTIQTGYAELGGGAGYLGRKLVGVRFAAGLALQGARNHVRLGVAVDTFHIEEPGLDAAGVRIRRGIGVLGADVVHCRSDVVVNGILVTAGVSLTGRRAGYLGVGVGATAVAIVGALVYLVLTTKD